MSLLRTKSFDLDVFVRGAENSERLGLVLPGKGDSKDYPHLHSHVEKLAGLGFIGVGLDPPGTWGSSGGTELYTLTNYKQAIVEVMAHYDNPPTLLVGHSRGGSMAMLLAAESPNVIGFVAAMSRPEGTTPLDPAAEVEIIYRETPPDDGEHMVEIALSRSFFEDAAQHDALPGLRTCHLPKLFLYGTKDEVIKPATVHATYDEAAHPKALYGLDSGHDYRRDPAMITEVDKVLTNFVINQL